MCIFPKLSLIDSLFWFHLFLNYLYLVALLNLKVSYAFMFCYSMRDKLKTICYVFHLIWTHIWLSLFHYSWSFVCVLLHVITWLLSFFYQNCVFHAHVLSSFDPITQFLLWWSRLWWCMSPQKLFFCYHLPTRGRAGVKHGDAWYVPNVSIIFDAPWLFLHHLLTILLHFAAFLCIFWN
jgi:hypothetical protein